MALSLLRSVAVVAAYLLGAGAQYQRWVAAVQRRVGLTLALLALAAGDYSRAQHPCLAMCRLSMHGPHGPARRPYLWAAMVAGSLSLPFVLIKAALLRHSSLQRAQWPAHLVIYATHAGCGALRLLLLRYISVELHRNLWLAVTCTSSLQPMLARAHGCATLCPALPGLVCWPCRYSLAHMVAAQRVVSWARKRYEMGLLGYGYPWEVRVVQRRLECTGEDWDVFYSSLVLGGARPAGARPSCAPLALPLSAGGGADLAAGGPAAGGGPWGKRG